VQSQLGELVEMVVIGGGASLLAAGIVLGVCHSRGYLNTAQLHNDPGGYLLSEPWRCFAAASARRSAISSSTKLPPGATSANKPRSRAAPLYLRIGELGGLSHAPDGIRRYGALGLDGWVVPGHSRHRARTRRERDQ
jgi:hypothetical protein